MATENTASRRDFLKLASLGVLAYGSSLVIPQKAHANLREPSLYCREHFIQTPGEITQDGETFYRQGRSYIYVSDSGNKIGIDGVDYMLSKDMMNFESEWENCLNGVRGSRMLAHSLDLDFNDLKMAIGDNKWNSLREKYQGKSRKAWGSFNHKTRDRVWHTYMGCYESFYLNLDPEKRTDFKRFVRAYKKAIEINENPEQEIFKTRDGSVTGCYNEHYPWLCISFPNVPDRAIIFGHEMNEHNGQRINWRNIGRLA